MAGLTTVNPTPLAIEAKPKEPRLGRCRGEAIKKIDLVDGKTRDCNRTLTFDYIVPAHKLPREDDPQKRVGATWEVLRAIGRLAKPGKKKNSVKRKRSAKWAGWREKMADQEKLL